MRSSLQPVIHFPEELDKMQRSSVIDIQSHTKTHSKYFISDRLIGFHHPKSDSLYTIANLYPEYRPYNITDPDFEKLLPFGYPFFEEASSVIAKKVEINEEFIKLIINSNILLS